MDLFWSLLKAMLKASTNLCPSHVLLSLLRAQFSGCWLGSPCVWTGGRSKPFAGTFQFLQQCSKFQKCWKYFRGCSNLARAEAAPSLQAGCWHGAVAEAQTANLLTGLNALATETGKGKDGIMASHALPLAKHGFSQGSAWPHNGKYSSMCVFLSTSFLPYSKTLSLAYFQPKPKTVTYFGSPKPINELRFNQNLAESCFLFFIFFSFLNTGTTPLQVSLLNYKWPNHFKSLHGPELLKKTLSEQHSHLSA